ncbi:hypothetical protein [Cupriavidus taiwanensis]|uniref:Uncharacterized protein n=1 Tax=Cupriavidus taiwanensis TaxID=164546 RepID=A0A7Z7NQ36_9BURK|nr:hypothetical protein [Cupriavidus taiwanensis]SOZ17253.1 hypothetical protein CBM2597_U10130 [Cupriavidus taiwanensis]SOZ96420.1 hypothetical protein CBM2598_U10222 [Cupriavidus taiwanensis]SPC25636.1 hypothetical protein CBM2594_U10137 [Cupriavidus taiwanensis]
MSQTNHFDAHLETSEHDDPQHDISEDVTDVSTSEKPKRKLPTNYLLYGAVAVAVLGFWGFKKMTKPSSPADFAASAPMNDGGMMSAAANPERPTSGSFAPVRQAQQEAAPQSFGPRGADPAMSNNSVPASPSELATASASDSGHSVASLAASAANDAAGIATGTPGHKEADRKEISAADAAILEQLKAQTVQLEDMGKRLSALETRRVEVKTESKPARASKPLSDEDRAREKAAGVVRAKASRTRTNSKEEVQLGYKIKQVIPGQAWLEDETGKQYVRTKGDKLGGSEIVEIDADKFIVRTTAGVIR